MPEITTASFHKLHAGNWRSSITHYFLRTKRAVELPEITIAFFHKSHAGKWHQRCQTAGMHRQKERDGWFPPLHKPS
ncbi:hypothetical protein [Ignatzschineria cameli]|uniref:hypothetical protein n=1 Tax=Ignatzschineria cameli TaxID=2182793 RepID=UPI0010577EF6|nr:hypothetical protein [Ignatzschineria cameli]